MQDQDLHATLDLVAGEIRGLVLESAADGPPRAIRVAEIRVAVRRDGAVLAALAGAVDLHRPVAGGRPALGDHPEADDLRAHGWPGGRADGGAARAGGRRAQLGLPLHVGARRLVLRARAAPAGHGRRGRPLRRLAGRPDPGDGSAATAARSTSCTASTAPPTSRRTCWTTGRATAARRRCGSATAPPSSCSSTSTARRWTAMYAASRAGAGGAAPRVDGDRRRARLAGRQLGPAGGGHLGDPRRAAVVHLRAGDVLGRLRPRHPDGRRARPAGAAGAVDRRAGPDLRAGHGQGLPRRAGRRSSSTTTPTSWTPRCCGCRRSASSPAPTRCG